MKKKGKGAKYIERLSQKAIKKWFEAEYKDCELKWNSKEIIYPVLDKELEENQMKFTLPKIKKLIKQSLTMGDIGHPLMDNYYKWYERLTGHPNPYYKLFYLLSKEFKPEFVVELGSYRAGASGHFAVGHPQATIVTIDMHKDMPQQFPDKAACIEAMKVIPNLTYINKCTVDNMPEYGYECARNEVVEFTHKQIDILFIDAWHHEKYVKREWELYSPLLADVALVICDDVANMADGFKGMEEWWNDFPYQKFLNNEVHPSIPMGFMKFQRKATKPGRPKNK